MTRWLSLALVLALFSNSQPVEGKGATLAESSDLKEIFNGKDLSGWEGDSRLWSVKEGVIHGETTSENKANGNTFLIWQEGNTKDFELRITFRCNATNNSGIQYRSKHITEDKRVRNKWVVQGYQHEIRNELDFPSVSGFIYDERGSRGRICLAGEQATWDKDGKKTDSALLTEAEFQKVFKLDGWNQVVIIAKGNRIQHFMNGKLILDLTDNHPTLALQEGVLALQLHAGAPMWVEFKDIFFKELK